jgi:peptidoglycan/xylan/chitin deacetylase (PgdA/CDA1 family)
MRRPPSASAPITRAADLPVESRARWRRWMRLATLHGLSPLAAAAERLAPPPRAHLRIVYYHFVFDDERAAFAEQLAFFRDHYRILPLGAAVEALAAGRLTEPTLAITFDDGYRNNRTNAAEVLARAGVPACFYLCAEFVSIPPGDLAAVAEHCRRRLRLPAPVANLTWEDARALRAAGHEIGSHTLSHANFASCGREAGERELADSKAVIEGQLGAPVRHFSIPYGRQPGHLAGWIRQAAQAAGYQSCVSTVRGLNLRDADPFALRRDGLEAGWTVREVRARLRRTVRRSAPVPALEGA